MITNLLKKVFGTAHEREIKRCRPVVARIGDLEPAMKNLSDAELRGQTAKFRERLDRGEPLNDLLPEAFATVREASSSACATTTCSSSAAWS
jgi:preprotein translocase subunit SecA